MHERKSLAFCLAFLLLTSCLAVGQAKEQVLWSFGAAGDGSAPVGMLLLDGSGNLYGVTQMGGSVGCGTVFELSPNSGSWTETIVHDFSGGTDGCTPYAGLVSDGLGNLYGTTGGGGSAPCPLPNGIGCGVVFELSPEVGGWTESILHSFGAFPDGAGPSSKLTFDSSGSLYGTTSLGGLYSDQGYPYGAGTVFQLVPGSNGWVESILFDFDPQSTNGNYPEYGVVLDQTGNVYGTTLRTGKDGSGYGLVYELFPTPMPPWTETVVKKFNGTNGNGPSSDLQIDEHGRVYGTTGGGGLGYGVAFRLTARGGTWAEQGFGFNGADGFGPRGGLLLNGSAVYGVTHQGGSPSCNDQGALGCGLVFRITGQTETVLYEFCKKGSPPNCPDGAYPGSAGVVTDGVGNLYGTTQQGGTYNQGVVFQISR
ncbi:MAG: hypothetical protein LAO09_07550 [Acidobacteriia bacterium]|nr:hypothetical protein [Terriglobia bacterium]